MEGSNFLLQRNPTFSHRVQVSALTEELCRHVAAWSQENQCRIGRRSEGSAQRGAEGKTLLGHSPGVLGSLCALYSRKLSL